MSLGISITTPEGIVLAADSRQSYRNQKNVSRVGSDSASKLFQLSSRTGVVVAGPAFLQDSDGINKNISKYIEDFRKANDPEKLTVFQIAVALQAYFSKQYQYKKILPILQKQLKEQLEAQGAQSIKMQVNEEEGRVIATFTDKDGTPQQAVAGIDAINFLLSGYNKDNSHYSYIIQVPGKISEKRNSGKRSLEYGAEWIGQKDVISRIVLGFDGRIQAIPLFSELIAKKGTKAFKQSIGGLEYAIQWGTMTLQDAIDFCVLMIKTTTAIQRFSDGIALDPGDIPGVGGAVDVAVITENKGFVWAQKKKLQLEKTELDLNQIANLEERIHHK